MADIKGRDFSELDKEAKANTEKNNKGSNTIKNRNTTTSDSRGRKNRRQKKKTMVVQPVQRLFDACREVFAHSGTGFVPPPEKIEQLSALLGMFVFSL